MPPLTDPEVHEVELPGVRLSTLVWGASGAPLVLALHGYPDTAWSWRHLGPHLAERGYRVVAPHTRGYAPSGVPPDGSYHVASLMADAVALHEALGGDRRGVVVGHDWGAITANALAGHEDSPFRAVISLAVPPLDAMSGSPLRLIPRQLRMSWYTMFNQLPFLPERLLDRTVRRLWRDWSPRYDATEDLTHVLRSLAEPANRAAAVGYYRAARSPWAVPEEHRTWKRSITALPKVPMLYLHGADDGCLQVGYAEHAAARLPPNARVEVVPDAGHFLQVEQPDVVNGLIADFLAVPY